MKYLLFNFRDIKHPNAGGADKMLFEIIKRLVRDGNEVIWFAPRFKDSADEEKVDGIKIIRKGNRLTVYFWVFIYYIFKFRGKVDVVLDSVNTLPFFTSLFIKEKKFVIIYQLAGNFLERIPFKNCTDYYNAPLPIFLASYYIFEPLILLLYKNVPCITISESTKKDLEKFGFKKINVITLGQDEIKLDSFKKESKPTLIFLSRLVGYKNPIDALSAFKKIKGEIKDCQLWFVGDGPLSSKLKSQNLKDVKFWGYVDENKKYKLLSKAHLLLFPSIREGWGLTVIEAAKVKTPTVGYNIQGLKDSIQNGKTGFLSKNPIDMADKVIAILKNKKLYNEISENACNFSKNFNWENTYSDFLKAINNYV